MGPADAYGEYVEGYIEAVRNAPSNGGKYVIGHSFFAEALAEAMKDGDRTEDEAREMLAKYGIVEVDSDTL